MNGWYFLSAFFLVGSVIAGYLGQQVESKKSQEAIKSDFQEEISDLSNDLKKQYPTAPESEIDKRVDALAEKFFTNKSLIISDIATNRNILESDQIKLSRHFNLVVERLITHTRAIVASYNQGLLSRGDEVIAYVQDIDELPSNIFEISDEIGVVLKSSGGDVFGYFIETTRDSEAGYIHFFQNNNDGTVNRLNVNTLLLYSLDINFFEGEGNFHVIDRLVGPVDGALKLYVADGLKALDGSDELAEHDSVDELNATLAIVIRRLIEWNLL